MVFADKCLFHRLFVERIKLMSRLTLCVHFSEVRDGHLPDKSEFQEIYELQFLEGRKRLDAYRQAIRKKPQVTK